MPQKTISLILLSALPPLLITAEQPTPSAPPLAITHVAVVDSTAPAARRDMTVLVRDGRIAAVEKSERFKVPRGSVVIDGTGKYLIPGLADMHVHWIPWERRRSAEAMAASALTFGVTTAFSPAMRLDDFPALKKLGNAPRAAFPRFFSTVVAYRPFDAALGERPNRTETPEAARESVRHFHSKGVDGIKLIYDDASYASRKPLPIMKREIMTALIDEAHRLGLKAYVHAPILSLAKEALRAGADGLIHGIVSDPVDSEFIALMKKNRAVYISTSSLFEAMADYRGFWKKQMDFYPTNPEMAEIHHRLSSREGVQAPGFVFDKTEAVPEKLPLLRSNLTKAYAAGINVVVGSDSGGGVTTLTEIVLHVESGLKPAEALQAATINAQRMVGRQREAGTIAAGKVADMVLLDADPLEDIRNIRHIRQVFRGGLPVNPAGHPTTSSVTVPRFVESKDGTLIAVHQSGSGNPILLVHGSAENGRSQWSQVEQFLAQRFNVFIMDRRGHGLSGDGTAYSLTDEANDIVSVARSLGKNVTVVAHSYGALCTLAALDRLENVSKVILYEPPLFPNGLRPDKAELFHQLEVALDAGDMDAARETGMRFVGLPAARIAAIKTSPGWVDTLMRIARIGKRELQTVTQYRSPPDQYGRVQLPVFTLLGTRTSGYLKDAAVAVCKSIRGCELVPLQDQGHIANLLAPELLATTITRLAER